MAEAKWTGVLSTTEPRNDVGIIKVRQGNTNSEIVEFQIVQNNKPYDLTGLTVYFCASFGLNLVEKPAVVVNTTGGKIQYTFDDDSMQAVGRQKGYFSIKKAESKIDSTQDFEFQVDSSLMTRSIDGKSYIYKLSTLIKVLDDFVKNGQNNFNVWFESVKEILYGVDPGGNILRELIEARKNSSGNIFASLKERLDKNEDDTNRQFAQKAFQKLSVGAMINDINFKIGDIIHTVGFENLFDKGGSFYQIVDTLEIADGYSLIEMSNGLKAKMIVTGNINPRSFGAIGDKLADDTLAIKRAIAYAESLKDEETIDRFDRGLTIYLLDGVYKITSGLTVIKSNITIKGESKNGTVIYAENCDFDMLTLDGSLKALYGTNVEDIRFHCPGNSFTGTQLRFLNVINSINDNVELSAGFESLEVNGGGKIFFNSFMLTQTNRTVGTPTGYLLKLLGDYGIPSDIHFTDLQITPNYLNQDYTALVKSCDGLYFNGFHLHGGLKFSPNNIGSEKTLASVFFDNCYFDTAREYNILFEGTADNYRNFFFSNTYLRFAKRGFQLATNTALDNIQFIGGKIAQQKLSGVFSYSDRAKRLKINGTIFENNNTDNVTTEGDVIISGQNNHVDNTSHVGGGTLGYAVHLKDTASNCAFDNVDITESTASKKVVDTGSSNGKGSIYGNQKTKNRGSATVLKGQKTVVVVHEISFDITGPNIGITPRTPLSGGTAYWISDVTGTTFTVNLQAIATENVIFSWFADVSR